MELVNSVGGEEMELVKYLSCKAYLIGSRFW